MGAQGLSTEQQSRSGMAILKCHPEAVVPYLLAYDGRLCALDRNPCVLWLPTILAAVVIVAKSPYHSSLGQNV
jgi:hypothetical protein